MRRVVSLYLPTYPTDRIHATAWISAGPVSRAGTSSPADKARSNSNRREIQLIAAENYIDISIT